MSVQDAILRSCKKYSKNKWEKEIRADERKVISEEVRMYAIL